MKNESQKSTMFVSPKAETLTGYKHRCEREGLECMLERMFRKNKRFSQSSGFRANVPGAF